MAKMKPPVRRLLVLISCWVFGYAALLVLALSGYFSGNARAIGIYGSIAATPVFVIGLFVFIIWLAIASTDRM
jgi:hypothetical protein